MPHPVEMSHKSRVALDHHKMLRRAQLEVTVLSSNKILPDRDQQDLREAVIEAKKEVELLDWDISQLLAALERLIERRRQGVNRLKRLRARLAPHRKLPPEIISQIFRWCQEDCVNSLRPDRIRSPAWDLSGVCDSWRTIALTEPSLWNRIEVPEHYSSSPTMIGTLSAIFSKKGGKGAVTFFVSLGCDEDWMMTQRLLFEHPLRLRELHLDIRTFPVPPFDVFHMFNNLKSLKIDLGLLGNFLPTGIPFIDLSTARDLRDFTIQGTSSDLHRIILPKMSVPWTQLTILSISLIPTHFVTILSQCVHLVHCSVSFMDSIQLISHSQITLNSLQTLKIWTSKDITPFLAILVTPALKSITFWIPEWPQNEFLRFVERSSCDIETFHACEDVVRARDVVPLMRAMAALTDFSAYTIDPMPKETLSIIAAEGLAQRLQTLKIKVASLSSATKFLRSRWSHPTHRRMYKARVFLYRPLSQDDISHWKSVLPSFPNHGENIELMGMDKHGIKPVSYFINR